MQQSPYRGAFTQAPVRIDCIPEKEFVKLQEDVFEDGYGCPNNSTKMFSEYCDDLQARYGPTPSCDLSINNQRIIYIDVEYPFKGGPYRFKFELVDAVKMSYECMMFANTIAMQQLENEDTPSIHCIEELVYNGASRIEIYSDYIVCSFDCDS